MRSKKTAFFTLTIVTLLAAGLFSVHRGNSQPQFYLATDKTFSSSEMPYINLEGMGRNEYEFRVYQIDDPVPFLTKMVKNRLVREKNTSAFGNAIALFIRTVNLLKQDFRTVARNEFNYKTRSHLKNAADVNFAEKTETGPLALPGLLEKYAHVLTFSIPRSKDQWSYRRISIPVTKNGLYLVEGVSGTNIAYTMIVKSGISFITKQSDQETIIFAARSDSGDPEKDATVILLNGHTGGGVQRGTTNNQGIFSLRGKSNEKSLILVNKGNEYAVSDPNFFARSFYGSGGVRAFVYTDRPIYRPGDQVSFKGILRNFRNNRYQVAAGGATIDIVNGDGKTVRSNIPVSFSGDNGTCTGTFELPNPKNVYLGTYNLVLKYGGEIFSTEFSVEAYKKPPFLVTVKTPKRTYVGRTKIPVTLTARFYHGNPVSGESVKYRVFRRLKYDYSPVGTLPFFENASEYIGMSGANTRKDLVVEDSGTLDDNGTLDFSVDPGKIDADYTYTILATVTASDATLSGSASFSVNRSAFFLKIQKEKTVYEPGDKVKVKVNLSAFDKTLSGQNLKKIIAHRKVSAVLYSRKFTNISQEAKREKITSLSATSAPDGTVVFTFPISRSGHYIVKFESEDHQGEETSSEITLWVSRKTDSIQVPFKNIAIKPSKDIYQAGDTAEILLMSPVSDGSMLITLEANRIIKHEIIKFKGNTYKYRVRITSALTPNFSLSAHQFSGSEVYQNQIKIVAPPIEKFIKVSLKPKKTEYRPGEMAEVEIETLSFSKKGVSAEVSIAVVDEALFQLQEDRNPKISTYFYHPRRNNVNTTLSTAYRFFGYAEVRRLQLALNSKENGALSAIKEADSPRKRFKDTCYWSAKVRTNRAGRATVRIPLAQNLTTWRVTAVAVTRDTRVGQAKTTFLAKKDLMLIGGLPGFMVRGSSQKVSATVTNLTGKTVTCAVSIKAENALVEGKKTRQITVAPRKNAQVYFQVKPPKKSSQEESSIQLSVRSGNLYDSMIQKIPLKHFGLERTVADTVHLEGEKTKITLSLPDKYAEPKLVINLSPGYGQALKESLHYLAQYPYGCIEQTMSRFMPLLAARQTGFISPELARKIPDMFSKGLASIQMNQRSDGSFSWFAADNGDAMMTSYVYRGLALCKKMNGSTNNEAMKNARRYLYRHMDRSTLKPFERAYILFNLSEGGKVEKSMVDSLATSFDRQTPYGKALTILTLINTGIDKNNRNRFKKALKESGIQKGRKDTGSKNSSNWEKDSIETAAALLTAAVRLNMNEKTTSELIAFLLINRKEIAWKNSRDTAMAVLALSEHLKKQRETSDDLAITISLNGTPVKEVSLSSKEIGKAKMIYTISRPDLIKKKNRIDITKEEGPSVFITAFISFFDRSSSFRSENRGISIKRKYYKMNGEKNGETISLSQSRSDTFSPGDLVMVTMQVKRSGKRDLYYMVEDPLPPGFSLVTRDTTYYSTDRRKEYTSRQLYDDRSVFFVSGLKDSFMIRYFLRANIPGAYHTMPARALLMYYPDITGSGSDTHLRIKK